MDEDDVPQLESTTTAVTSVPLAGNAIANFGMEGNSMSLTSNDDQGTDMEPAMSVPSLPAAFASRYNDNCDSFNVGEMSERCEHCDARMFSAERVKGHFSLCCSNGKVVLPNAHKLKAVPVYLKTLLTSNSREAVNLRGNIRNYNSALAFASVTAHIDTTVSGSGTYAYRIHGEVYVQVGHVGSETPSYNQLFVIDSEMALEYRMQRNENRKCLASVMSNLDAVIRSTNPYAEAYKNFSETERQIGNAQELQLIFSKDPSKDKTYNAPQCGEVAVVFNGSGGNAPDEIDFAVFKKEGTIMRISHTSSHADPMVYPLLFPNGERGWHPFLTHNPERSTAVRHRLTMLQFYKFRLMDRGTFTALHNGGKLFQQFLALSYVKHETNRLFWVRHNQPNFRVERYQGLMDSLARDAADDNRQIGRMIILPSSFINSPRNMQQNYQDAMAIVNKFGKPDLFITFTCNPKWPEIANELQDQQKSEFRPDLVARVFNLKLKEMIKDIKEREVFGKVLAMIHVIEFQKRGLPHAHMLIILENCSKIRGREMIDCIVSSEIPNAITEPNLYDKVTRHMVHGPCGHFNPLAVCMENSCCKKEFPKPLCSETLENKDGYPVYRRSEGMSFMRNGISIDNGWIVPYNKFLIQKYDAHINVEVCSSIKSVKYLYKYLYKGHDKSKLELRKKNPESNDYDEIQMYVDARYVTSPEAAWRLFEFKMHEQSHAIIRLAVHLPLQQSVVFQAGQEEEALNRASNQTSLTAFFKLCCDDAQASDLIYPIVGEFYVFTKGIWKRRVMGRNKVICRMYAVSPLDRERYFLRLLLLNVRGPKSFEDLKTVNGILLPSFHEAAKMRGLLDDDEESVEMPHRGSCSADAVLSTTALFHHFDLLQSSQSSCR